MKKYTRNLSRFISISFLLLLAATGVQAATGSFVFPVRLCSYLPPDGPDTLKFPLHDNQNPYDKGQNGGLYLKDPSNVKEDVQFDPNTNEYTLTRKIGDMDYRPPASMSFEEYKNWNSQEALQNYWRERANASTGPSRLGVIPQIKVGSQIFDRIFGGNTIDVRPQGSTELMFGVKSDYRKDPLISPKLRRTTNFDFDMKIQLNVIAKIGDKIEFNTNYNTEATFDFENKLKLKYEGKEDEIVKLVEAGHVSMPLNSTLISGSQSLFGLKTQLQFGKATVTTIFSQQQSQVENLTVQGGAQTQKFTTKALDYEENRHFFLSQYFREHYDEALANLPVIASNVNITKIEVWVTNVGAPITENRNFIAFQDLGEYQPYRTDLHPVAGNRYPSNLSNDMLYQLDTNQIRDLDKVSDYLSLKGYTNGTDFVKIENARKLNPSEYYFNSKLGFISLNTAINPDQTLAVSYEYTILGSNDLYQVGEFSDQSIPTHKCLIMKLLKSSASNTRIPMWDLMMKNVYNLSAYNVNREDFILNILYTGNNSAVPTGFLPDGPENIKGVPLIRLLGFDRTDPQMNPYPDGIFDFIDNAARNGGTIQASNGRVYFTVTEPFGSYLRSKLNDDKLAAKYCFDSLYTLTKTGAQQYPEKNKFVLEGQYKSESGSDISLNALNVPQGSVKVTAGGVPLVEGQDYQVDYTLGRVKIINQGILNSGTPIKIQLENNSMFNVYSQRLMGAHVDYKVNKDLLLGGTLLNLHERPITQKTNYGDEPISNTIWGGSINYNHNSGFITKMVDRLPFISTKAISKLRIDAEFAQFIPGHSSAVGKAGTSYIDDFEGAKSSISLYNASSWFLASTPQGQTTRNMFPEAAPGTHLAYGYNRARLAWYTVDRTVFGSTSSSLKPKNVDNHELSKNATRIVYEKELFPQTDQAYAGQENILSILNLSYFPAERGPYNYDVDAGSYSKGIDQDGNLNDPESRWAGIQRKVETSDFEASNVEYISFWLMDPFDQDSLLQGCDLYFNLGDVSEDLLRDGRKSFEDGLPETDSVMNVDTTDWGRVPTQQSLTSDFKSYDYQDIGYDGLKSPDEALFFGANFLDKILQKYGSASKAYLDAKADPSSDDFHSFLGGDYDSDPTYSVVVNRYKHFCGPEGNTPANNSSSSSTIVTQTRDPNTEDINHDNTLSDQERYFQYVMHIEPQKLVMGENNIVDVRPTEAKAPDGKQVKANWYQVKIPIQQPEKVIGSIQDFKSIRFIRVFIKGSNRPVTLRLANFELERGEWRKYYNSLLSPGEYIPDPNQDATTFDISSVSVEENSERPNVVYLSPPDIDREINAASSTYQRMNEQALSFKICDLLDGDARGAYKTTDFDFRDYSNLQMFIHAEKLRAQDNLSKGDLSMFVRIGSDFTSNYYEYEVPLTFTEWRAEGGWAQTDSDKRAVWPADNELNINLDQFVALKKRRNEALSSGNASMSTSTPYTILDGANKMTIVGTPSMSDVRAMMIGVRNPRRQANSTHDDGLAKCAEVWFNELRLTGFNEKSGWAANARVAANLADLGNVVVSGAYSSPSFASLEKKITERQKEAVTQFDFATNLELGKFLPEKSGIRIPVHYDYSQTISNPQYNPLDPDILYSETTQGLNRTEKDSLRNLTTEVIKRQNLNFMNVHKDRVGPLTKPHLWDIQNFDLSYAYSQYSHHSVDLAEETKIQHRGGIGYNYTANPKAVRPFQKSIKSRSLGLIKDFNFYYLPKMISFRTDMNRDYQKRLLRNKSTALVILEPSYTKNWEWNRIYDVKYDLSQSLKVDYNANVNTFIHEPPGAYDRSNSNFQQYKDSIWRSILGFGTMNRFNQSMNLNYALPFNKIPLLNWVTANARYGAKYRWEASPTSLQPRFGNTIENSRDLQLNGNIRLVTLYDKVGFLKKVRQSLEGNDRKGPGLPGAKPGERDRVKEGDKTQDPKKDLTAGKDPKAGAAKTDSTDKPKKDILKLIGNNLIGVLMSVKDANITYNQTNGIILPGFRPEPGPLGNNWSNNSPGMGFIFGSQADIKEVAANGGWLSTDSLLNNPYQNREIRGINFRSNLEPVKNFKIDITADRSYSNTYQAAFKYNPSTQQYETTAEQQRGTFNISYIMWPTAFKRDNALDQSPVFEKLLEYRIQFAEKLAAENPNSVGRDSLGFPKGYGATQSQVLMYSFLAAYSGRGVSKTKANPFPSFPLPNWRITYNAVQGIKYLKTYFNSFNITHSYRSNYQVGGFQNDLKFESDMQGNPMAVDNSGNYIPQLRMDVVSITEQFSPLIGFDVTMKNSMLARIEYKKTRNLALSFANNQVTEIRSGEFVFGTGYRFKSVPFTIKSLATGNKTKIKSDLNVKLDFSIRDSKTVLRKIEDDQNQVSTGTIQYSINASADYMVSQKLNLRFYYDQTINSPHLKGQIPTSNTNAGIALRFTLSQ